MTTVFQVCGTPTLDQIKACLAEAGYQLTFGPISALGQYTYIHTDAAPGWSDWMYEVEVWELPEHPIQPILKQFP